MLTVRPAERAVLDAIPELKRPKQEIAEYIGSVQAVFSSLGEAVDSREPFYARSENPNELHYSGIVPSILISPQSESFERRIEELSAAQEAFTNREDIHTIISRRRVGKRIAQGCHMLQEFCDFAGINANSVIAQQSYSYWPVIPGINRYAVADSGNPARLYVGTIGKHDEKGSRTCLRRTDIIDMEEGCITGSFGSDCTPETGPDAVAVAELYESLRHTPGFNHANCPIIEFVSDPEGSERPVQYHPGATSYTGESPDIPDSEHSAGIFFVRGATPPEGVEFDLRIGQSTDNDRLNKTGLHGFVDGTYDRGLEGLEQEALARDAEVVIVSYDLSNIPDPRRTFLSAMDSLHVSRTTLFQPKVSLSVDGLWLRKLLVDAGSNNNSGIVRIRLKANGQTAELKVI